MSSDVIITAIRNHLESNWTATTIKWENETFEFPQPTAYPDPPAAWLAVEVSGGLYQQQSIGSGNPSLERWTERGTVLVYSLVQNGAGSLVAHQNAKAVVLLFRGLVLPNNLRFQDMVIGSGGPGDDDGNWWQLLLRIEWEQG